MAFQSHLLVIHELFSKLVLLLCISSFVPKLTIAMLPSNTTDQLALLSFKSLLSDPLRILDSWNTSTHFCQWSGVSCGGGKHPDRVTALVLESFNLTGTLSPHVANLTFLRKLHLSNNNLRGRIPEEFGSLYRLWSFNLSGNSLAGKIPANLSRCKNLGGIFLNYNMLVGTIPKELGLLPKLVILNLGGNPLTGGIPSSLGNITSLKGLLFFDCELKGSIPDAIGMLTKLVTFQVTNNDLSGSIPPSLYNISSLVYLTAGGNRFVGTLPPYMFQTLRSLQMLILNENQLTGPIPVSLPNASNLVEIDLKNNSFFGTVPSNLGLLKNLYWLNLGKNHIEARNAEEWTFLSSLTNCSLLGTLELANNKLAGELPSSISNLSKHLDWLSMGQNQISGSMPEDIGNLANLTVLSLNKNRLTGIIPESITKLRKLSVLNLSRNNFSGSIPSSIGNLTQLIRLYLEESGLSGSIPASFGHCKSLEELNLSYNNLSGRIPQELLSLSSLSTYLNVSNNGLNGPLPAAVSNLKNLGELDISGNRLSGDIPSSIGDCQSMEYLHMEGNTFSGSIPQSFSNLKALRELYLSRNNLSGKIPQGLGTLKVLQALDLSLNNLSGDIPKSLGSSDALIYLNLSFNNLFGEVAYGGIFRNSSVVSLEGNSGLCGGDEKLDLPACYTQSSKKKQSSLALKIVIPLFSLILCLIVSLLVVTALRQMNSSKNKSLLTFLAKDLFTKISYAELLKATDGFSISNLVGTGSFGSVFKGVIGSHEEIVAIKVLNLQKRGALKSFVAECEVLKNIRHRNLVKIISLCVSIDFEGKDFIALILHYMPNGSLEQWLHPINTLQSRSLSFLQRLNIAIDVASALDYLHNHGHIPIVHCDLKPSNVLLDDNMCAHVSDFGLAKFLLEDPNSSYHLTSSIGVRGSIGYIAPEYGMGGQVSTLGDIYSYGILLLEMFSGRSPTDDIFKDDLGLHHYVEAAFPDRIPDIVDPFLLQDNDQPNKESILDMDEIRTEQYKCLVSVIRIALSCSKESPGDRMDISSVLKRMHAIRDLLVRSVSS